MKVHSILRGEKATRRDEIGNRMLAVPGLVASMKSLDSWRVQHTSTPEQCSLIDLKVSF